MNTRGGIMEEQIMELLKKENGALSIDEISDHLNVRDLDHFKTLMKELNRLEEELKVYRTKKDKYMIFQNSNLQIGTLMATKKSYGFVDIEGEEDVFIPPTCMNQAIHGDKVVVEITSKKGLRLEGRIVRIVERKLRQMVGEVIQKGNLLYVDLDNEKVKLTIKLIPQSLKGAMPGHKVLVKIGKKLEGNTYEGEVLKILGHKNDPGVDILSIVNELGINDVFPEEVMAELDQIPNEVLEKETVGRRNLRDQMIFTIDGNDTKDIDDAISLELLENGNYRLGVHIADVSYYVREGTELYKEALERGTSVYLADRVIPMLPHKLSNGICSLNPGVERLAISCVMEINDQGEVVEHDIFESVICSKKQMTYEKVNCILEKEEVPEGYEEFAPTILQMKKLADILRENKVRRGYIDFDLDESKIIVNEQGEAIDVVLRDRGTGEKLIEDFMIVANETVASHVYYMDLPFIYRDHGEPREEKIQKFLHFVSSLGYEIKGKVKDIHPKTMQDILKQLKEKKEFPILSSLMLRSMQKAIYDTTNIGHFGIASPCYTHFTSPIRRFPDTTVHRLLRKYLFQNQISRESITEEEQKLPYIAEHSSEKERVSIECERQVDDMKKAEYMEKHIGETYRGMISTIVSFGMFVELPESLIEGLIRVEDLNDDYYVYDEASLSLVGKRNKRGYRLGDEITVIVKSADKETRMIDFVIDDEKNRALYGKKASV